MRRTRIIRLPSIEPQFAPCPSPPHTHTHTVAVPICAVLHPRIHTRPAFDTAARSPRLAADTRTPGVLAWSSGRL